MSFGFSVGDFVATILLIKDVTQALNSSSGSVSEVKELSEHLESLMKAIIISGDVYRLGSLDDLRLETRFAVEAIRAGIEIEHVKCRDVLESFMKSLKPYTNSLVRGRGLSLVRHVKKVTWLHRKDDVAKLERSIGNHLRTLNMYGSALSEIYATHNAKGTGEILSNMVEIRLELTKISGAVQPKHTNMPRSLGYPWEANYSAAYTVVLLDAIGRNVTLPLALLGSTKDLHDILLVMYRNIRGREKIMRKEYTITDEGSDGALIDDMNWSTSIEGGMQLSLNIVFPALETFDDMRCPSCHERSLGNTLPGKRRRCHKCQFTFRLFDKERIVEEEDEKPVNSGAVGKSSEMAATSSENLPKPESSGQVLSAKSSSNDNFLFRSVHYHREIRKFKKPSKPKVQEGELPALVIEELPPLHKAAAEGSVSDICKLVDQGLDIDTPLSYNTVLFSHSCDMLEEFGGCTPLHLACWFGHLPAITALLDKGANILASASSCSEEVLGYAILGKKPERVFYFLVSRGARSDYRDRTGISPFINACAAGMALLLPIFLDSGVDINRKTDFGYTALGLAAHGAHERTVEMLLDQGAEIGYNDRGWAALHYAAAYSWTSIMQSLLDRGEDPNALDSDGCLPLHVAARWEKAEACSFLLDHTTNVNLVTKSSMTILHWAAMWGLNDIIELLVQKGADCNIGDQYGYTSLHYACSRPNFDSTVRLLLQSGARVDATSKDLETPMIQAAWFNNTNIVEILLQHNADVNAATATGLAPLHYASWRGYKSLIEVLLSNGANIEARTKALATPLHRAAAAGETSTVELLLQKGADIHARAKDLSTTLHWATGSKSTETLQLLLDHGAEIDAVDDTGAAVLHWASSWGYEDVFKMLLNNSASVHQLDFNGMSPLHWAAGRNPSVVRLLLEHGADVNLLHHLGRTALHSSARIGCSESISILLEYGADPNAASPDNSQRTTILPKYSHDVEKSGCTPLICASEYGRPDAVRLLLEAGADINAFRIDGKAALSCAVGSGNVEIIETLLANGVDVEFPNPSGLTPLAQASRIGKENIVRVLLEDGAAALDVRDPEGRTALHWACLGGFVSTARILLDHGAKVTPDFIGRTPLHDAVYKGSEPLVQLLLEQGANPLAKLKQGMSLACWSKYTTQQAAIVDAIKESDDSLKEKSGVLKDEVTEKDNLIVENATDIAENRGWTGIVELLAAAVSRSSS